jgi:hypothetical protein
MAYKPGDTMQHWRHQRAGAVERRRGWRRGERAHYKPQALGAEESVRGDDEDTEKSKEGKKGPVAAGVGARAVTGQ